MVSPEFKASITEKNLLRTRIMLKDSFVIDPTFMQLTEMLTYAKANLPDLMVPFDNDYLENDPAKWSSETMNEELVQLVTNFSDVRVNHLKKVVAKVLAKEAEAIKRKRMIENAQNARTTQRSPMTSTPLGNNTCTGVSDPKEQKRKEALRKMATEARKVNKILYEVDENQNRWKYKNIDDLERAAEAIIKAVNEYRINR